MGFQQALGVPTGSGSSSAVGSVWSSGSLLLNPMFDAAHCPHLACPHPTSLILLSSGSRTHSRHPSQKSPLICHVLTVLTVRLLDMSPELGSGMHRQTQASVVDTDLGGKELG